MIIELITILQYTLIIDTVKLRKDAIKNSVFFLNWKISLITMINCLQESFTPPKGAHVTIKFWKP